MSPRLKKGLVIGAIVAVVLAVGGPWVYINFIKEDAKEELTLSTQPGATDTTDAPGSTGATDTGTAENDTDCSTGGVDLDGTWTAGEGSEAGYRVTEVLLGQDTTATGRTSGVTGSITVSGTKVTAADFTVDMTTVKTDESRRDGQFQGRIMDTAQFPTSTFTLSTPIDLTKVPGNFEPISAEATGSFTIRGVTKSVTFTANAQLADCSIEINGKIPVKFADYSIPDPSFGPAQVNDDAVIEFLLKLSPGPGA